MLKFKHPRKKQVLPDRFVLIDSSSFFFYRVFATVSWWNRAHADQHINLNEDVHTISDIDEFKFRLVDQAEKHLVKIEKQTNTSRENMFLIRDCPRHDIWRMSYSSSYKDNRDNSGCCGQFIKLLNSHFQSSFKCVFKSTRAEADDAIAFFSLLFRQQYPTIDQFIVSGDSDLAQLVSSNVTLINPRSKPKSKSKSKSKSRLESGDNVSPSDVIIKSKMDLLKKVIKGDSSDSIRSIGLRVNIDKLSQSQSQSAEGDTLSPSQSHDLLTRWAQISQKLYTMLQKKPYLIDKYLANRQLIDFHYLPYSICNHIYLSAPDNLKRLVKWNPSSNRFCTARTASSWSTFIDQLRETPNQSLLKLPNEPIEPARNHGMLYRICREAQSRYIRLIFDTSTLNLDSNEINAKIEILNRMEAPAESIIIINKETFTNLDLDTTGIGTGRLALNVEQFDLDIDLDCDDNLCLVTHISLVNQTILDTWKNRPCFYTNDLCQTSSEVDLIVLD